MLSVGKIADIIFTFSFLMSVIIVLKIKDKITKHKVVNNELLN